METILKKELKIDKTNWELVKFGDVAFEPKETMKDIVSDGIEHVVGLEHITSGDIHLRNSASIDESTTFTKKYAKGDVLFGRRRAYLKKAALAHFDGICSGDITVFRAKSNLLPKLLPFIVNNDKFFDYAIQHSAGGLSPRVKFKDLSNYEFLLPPKDQQAQLAELLWAMDEVIEREKEMLKSFITYKESKYKELLYPKQNSDKFKAYLLKEVANFRRGSFPQPYGNKEWYDEINGYPFIQVNDIDFNLKLKETTNFKISKLATPMSVFVPKGTLIVSIQGSIGRIAITQYDAYFDRTILIFTDYKIDINKTFLIHVLKYLFQEKEKTARGATIKTITKEELSDFEIHLPDFQNQNIISEEIEEIEINFKLIENKVESSKTLQKSIINQVF